MTARSREALLRSLVVGDIFHGSYLKAGVRIFIATAITEAVITARSVTTQDYHYFDRRTGIAEFSEMPAICAIDSVAPLPVDLHNLILGRDRRYRLGATVDSAKLTEAERRAIIPIYDHYLFNPV